MVSAATERLRPPAVTAPASPPVRVLHVAAAGERGGAESVLLSILRNLDGRRTASVVALLQPGPLADQIEDVVGTRPHVIAAGRFRDIVRAAGAVRQLMALIHRERASLVHCHGTVAQIYGSAAARLIGVPAVYHLHDMPEPAWNAQGLLGRGALATRPAAIIAVSRAVAKTLRGGGRRVRVVPNSAPVSGAQRAAAHAEGASVRARLGWHDSCPLVVWCGRLQRWKGADVFLRAAACVAAKEPQARFAIVGGELFDLDRGFASELRRLAASLGIEDVVAFAGHQRDPLPYIAAADVLAHSSVRPEPFGLVIVEAMALGTAVVAADAGGPAEILHDGVTGLLAPPGDHQALADRLLALLRDPVRRAAIAGAARASVEHEYSIDRMIGRLHAIYDEVTGA